MKEIGEKIVFRGRELDLLAASGHHAPLQIDLDVSETDQLGDIGGGPPQYRPYAGQQLTRAKRLDDVVVRSDFKQHDLVDFFPTALRTMIGVCT